MVEAWGSINTVAQYTGKSPRVIRYWLKKGLRHSRIEPGGIVIKYQWVDEFLEKHEAKNKVDQIINQIMSEL